MAPAEPRVWYSAVCSGTSLVGASPDTSRPSGPSRDSRAGSRKPSEALVGVTSQPPSSSFTLMLPEEPGVSPRSNSERPNRQMSSRILASLILRSLERDGRPAPISKFEHDLVGKPVPTFPDLARIALSHALAARPSRDRQGQAATDTAGKETPHVRIRKTPYGRDRARLDGVWHGDLAAPRRL